MDRDTGAVSVIRHFSNPNSQVISIAGDTDWIVWAEASIQPTFGDWAIYSLDRHSGQIRLIASAPKSYPQTPYIMVSMSNGVIVWSAVEAADGVLHVYAASADGSSLRIVAANARGPQIVWPWVVYDVKPVGPGQSATLERLNLETGAIEKIAGPTDVSYFAYDGEALAWISTDGAQVLLESPLNSPPVRLTSTDHAQFVSMNRRLVGWGQSAGAFVYDRKLRAIIQLSDLHGFYPVLSAQALDWLFQPDPNASNRYNGTVWRDVDIAQLP